MMCRRGIGKMLQLVLVGVLLTSFSACRTAKSGAKITPKDAFGKAETQQPADRQQSRLYKVATSWIGTPYSYGGHGSSGVDCSGLVMEVYKEVYGIQLHRNSAEIFQKDCVEIPRNEIVEGDLVFFTNDSGSRINHVGIYLDDDKFVHSSSSKGVVISDLKQNYYVKRFYKAGRVVGRKM